jgi:AcrR family transcriptional regulator
MLEYSVMTGTEKLDGRRAAGLRTRRRLLDASRALVAERGAAGVTLRAITEEADANVAAVSYHFGSTDELLQATIEEAAETLAQAQIDGLRQLPGDASVADIAAAWARPVIAAVSGPPSASHALIRIAARAATDPSPRFRERIMSAATRADDDLLGALRRALPGVPDELLLFRRECAAGAMHFMASGAMRVDLEARTDDELELLLVPALAGALSGGLSEPA